MNRSARDDRSLRRLHCEIEVLSEIALNIGPQLIFSHIWTNLLREKFERIANFILSVRSTQFFTKQHVPVIYNVSKTFFLACFLVHTNGVMSTARAAPSTKAMAPTIQGLASEGTCPTLSGPFEGDSAGVLVSLRDSTKLSF